MHYTNFLLALAPLALAKTVTVCVQTTTGEAITKCETVFDSTSVEVVKTVTSTNDVAITSTVEATKTSTVYTTVTPGPQTISTTITSTSTSTVTAANITDVFMTTTTFTEIDSTTTTSTSTQTETDTASTTTTTAVNTATIPAGWQNILDTQYSGGTYPVKRDLESSKRNSSAFGGIFPFSNSSWPKEVRCRVTSIVKERRIVSATIAVNSTTTAFITTTATNTLNITSTAATPIITSTSTATATTTYTIPPLYVNSTSTVSTTTTSTSTITQSATSTTTTTTTLTFTATLSTNAACSTDNLLGTWVQNGQTYEGNNLFNNGASSGSVYTTESQPDAYSCCNSCWNTVGCTGSIEIGGTCFLLYSGTSSSQCVQSQNSGYYSYTAVSADTPSDFTMSNGLCGFIYQEV